MPRPALAASICSIFLTVLWTAPAKAIESLGYDVVARHGDVEVRAYAPHLLATVVVDASFERAGNIAFRDLFDYIDGNNESGTIIAMTAPVIQAPQAQAWQISFVMPAAYSQATLPSPSIDHIEVRSEPAKLMAALTYSGNWNRERFVSKEAQLRGTLEQLNLETCGDAVFARHNPPFWPSFLRKNEVLLPLCQ